jgi:hypothetical protein
LKLLDALCQFILAVDATFHDDVLQECLIKAIDGIGLGDIEVLFTDKTNQFSYLRLRLPYLLISFRSSGLRCVPAALVSMLRRMVQQSPCDPLVGSMQRSPFALVAQHWFICDLPFY